MVRWSGGLAGSDPCAARWLSTSVPLEIAYLCSLVDVDPVWSNDQRSSQVFAELEIWSERRSSEE